MSHLWPTVHCRSLPLSSGSIKVNCKFWPRHQTILWEKDAKEQIFRSAITSELFCLKQNSSSLKALSLSYVFLHFPNSSPTRRAATEKTSRGLFQTFLHRNSFHPVSPLPWLLTAPHSALLTQSNGHKIQKKWYKGLGKHNEQKLICFSPFPRVFGQGEILARDCQCFCCARAFV